MSSSYYFETFNSYEKIAVRRRHLRNENENFSNPPYFLDKKETFLLKQFCSKIYHRRDMILSISPISVRFFKVFGGSA